jgi:hypothetical protein
MYYREIPATVRATIEPKSNGKNYSGDKEMVSAFSLIVQTPEGMAEAITVRCWMGRSAKASVVYASVWVHGDKGAAGHGTAGGYGYHKQSEAIARAVESAGIRLYGNPYARETGNPFNFEESPLHFGGTGESAYPEIFQAIARAAGFDGPALWISHG